MIKQIYFQIITKFKKAIKKIINFLGYDLKRKTAIKTEISLEKLTPEQQVMFLASTNRALYRALNRGLIITDVVDIGASNGSWSKTCMEYYPNANYQLIEANSYHKTGLEKFVSEHHNAKYTLAAAGSQKGKCYFDDSDPFGGVAADKPKNKIQTPVKMINPDSLYKKITNNNKFLLKLDTHGFEQSILQGSKEILKHAELVVIEAYIHNLGTSESITFDQLCKVMDKYGFRTGDFSEPMWRPADISLWQWDLFFYRKENIIFKNNTYSLS